jgi:hypothetical protein
MSYRSKSFMADERFPNDPYRPTLPGDDLRDPAPLELQHNELQPDPGLSGAPARIAIYAVAALALGAAFYGLNKLSIHPSG